MTESEYGERLAVYAAVENVAVLGRPHTTRGITRSKNRSKKGEMRSKIISILSGGEEMSAGQVGEITGTTLQSAANALGAMLRTGAVTREKVGPMYYFKLVEGEE